MTTATVASDQDAAGASSGEQCGEQGQIHRHHQVFDDEHAEYRRCLAVAQAAEVAEHLRDHAG
jgi:hypothetical protein